MFERYTVENLAKRKQLKRAKIIKGKIDALWNAVLHMSQGRDETHMEGVVSKSAYMTLNRLMYKSVVPDYDEEEAMESAANDWKNDIQRVRGGDGNSLNYGAFFDSIFEIADNWATGIDENECVLDLVCCLCARARACRSGLGQCSNAART